MSSFDQRTSLQKDENGRIGRWAVQLANMKYKIKYKKKSLPPFRIAG